VTSISCDIVIMPTGELAKKAVILSEELRRFDTLFTLNRTTGPFPHASLYMTQLKEADLASVKAILSDIAASTQPFDLAATRYGQTDGYIDADYTRTAVLDRLQMAVVETINPIRDGMREKDTARMREATGKVRENLEQYGYRGVGELFRPHMTLTRFADEKIIDTDSLPEPNEFSGRFVSLGLFEMGDNGTCARKIADFKLGERL
jgi:hypothetical protein